MSLKLTIILLLAVVAITLAAPTPDQHLPGGEVEMTIDEAEKKLNYYLLQLSKTQGPSYKIAKMHSGTSQMAQGIVYRFKVDLIDATKKTKNCLVVIHALNGFLTTFHCDK